MFFRKPLFKEFFIVAVVVAILHYLALQLYLYWTVDWFDIVMHTLGGFLISIFVLFVVISYSDFENLKRHRIFIVSLIIGLTLVVGLTWELWEIFVGFTDTLKDLGDTVLDVIMDTVGAILAIIYSRKYLWTKIK